MRGGGEHSVYMNNVRANGGVIVNKLDSRVRIVTSGNTTVSVTVLQTGAILVGDGFETVEIPAGIAAEMSVEIQGNIDRLVNNSESVKIMANGTIQTVEANAKTEINGKDKVIRATGSADVSLNGNDVSKASGSSSGKSSGGSSQPAPTVYSISLDTNAFSLNEDSSTRRLEATTEPAGLEIIWTSSDVGVATVDSTGLVTAVNVGTATITASILDGAYTAACTVTVKENEVGWGEATGTDSRFAEGYPICTTAGGKIVIKVKIPEASVSNPVEVYMIVNQANADTEAAVTAVLHGHSSNSDGMVWIDAAPYLQLTDGEEHTITTDVAVYGDSDIRVDFVLKDTAKVSDAVTTVMYTAALVAEVDEVPPSVMSAYLNAARNTIYLHIWDTLDTTSVPDASAFAITGVEGASISTVQLTQRDDLKDWVKNRAYLIKLSVNGIAADADISGLRVRYTKPDQNPIQDTATVPNAMGNAEWAVKTASIALKPTNVQVSSDGQYIYFKTTNSDYFITNANSFKVTVKNAVGEEIRYTSSWSFANDGSCAECWMERTSGPVLNAGNSVTLTLIPADGMVDYAMDPVTETITASGTAVAASMEISSAVYEASKERLTVMISGAPAQENIYACSFQLIDTNGNTCTLRGLTCATQGEDGIVFSAENMPVVPQSGWQLRYKVQHANASSHSILSEPSGKPMAEQTVSITMQ